MHKKREKKIEILFSQNVFVKIFDIKILLELVFIDDDDTFFYHIFYYFLIKLLFFKILSY